MICGDFNARCGNLEEADLPKRHIVDATVNARGRDLVDCFKTLDLCILNGRFDRDEDGHTSVSTRGMAVVDYMICPTKSFDSFEKFRVVDPMEVIIENNLAIDSKVPDHRLITVDISMEVTRSNKRSVSTGAVKRMPENYMHDQKILERLQQLGHEMSGKDTSRSVASLDDMYGEFCDIIESQLDVKQPKPRKGHGKQWWNSSLSAQVKEVRKALKQWEANRSNDNLKLNYLQKQKQFSKLVRSSKRKYKGRDTLNY